jgi:putative oxidoreductase
MWLFRTYPSWAPIFARLALGVIFFGHGAQKLLGLFGGPGMSNAIKFFQSLGIPPALATVAIVTEFFGGIAVTLGLFTRIASIGLAIDMFVAICKVHLQYGFFLNGKGPGIEYNLALIGLALSLLVWGAGNLSIDQVIGGSKDRRR